MIRRVYVEKREAYREQRLAGAIRRDLGIEGLREVRCLQRYDVEGVGDGIWEDALWVVFAEAATEVIHEQAPFPEDATVFAVEYLPGQFDQRADSAEQCLRLLGDCEPVVRTAEVLWLEGAVGEADLERIKRWRINPVDSREADRGRPETLRPPVEEPAEVAILEGFRGADRARLAAWHGELGLAMSLEDLAFCQKWFAEEAGRDPRLTEIKVLDTYWSDHCRHTTFLTELTEVSFAQSPYVEPVQAAWKVYQEDRRFVYGDSATERPVCLMDMALMGMKRLRKEGRLAAMEDSEEVNAASVVVEVEVDGKGEEWLLLFKNETHNHPTEIEPFGGAATCLGGAIRDPLSGRGYVYQAMRITGAGDPRAPLVETLPGKLPQRKITVEAAEGYSSYGNQIGLATGQVREIYHPGYVAKRMEIGAVVGAVPRGQVRRCRPEAGDVVLLVGGRTGRDGIGGATGSSKEHSETALENAAEVQKGDPPTERKLQRLFRHGAVSRMIKRCNDFGAGGVSVAIGELADGVAIDLDRVPLKYAGLDGTEIALSESQERMAVVVAAEDAGPFTEWARRENLECVPVAEVTAEPWLRMRWRGREIVGISREFLDTNGVRQEARARVAAPVADNPLYRLPEETGDLGAMWKTMLGELNVCSQRGLVERFDSTVGAGTVLHPYGGCERTSPPEAMASLFPVRHGRTRTASLMSAGFAVEIAQWSPFHGGVYAVVESVARIVATGGRVEDCWLTLQEYFERLRDEPERWGKPMAALLGALTAQRELGIAAIGGKDSMSGSFGEMDVPPTLVSFAVCAVSADRIRSPEFKAAGHRVWKVGIERDAADVPDWESLRRALGAVAEAVGRGEVLSVSVVGEGGVAAAISRMAMGNRIGFGFAREQDRAGLFIREPGSLVLELASGAETAALPGELLGHTLAQPVISVNGASLDLTELRAAWEAPLEGVFPTRQEGGQAGEPVRTQLYEPHLVMTARSRVARPRVVLPVFPGTNCEYDTARAFEEAGAEVCERVLVNLDRESIEASVRTLAEDLAGSQILMLAGGFSAGDEPGGSGKFIASLFRHPRLQEAVHRLLREQDGLVLGICNGFQALVKLGLLPHGEIRQCTAAGCSLTGNTLGRHVSGYAKTKVVSRLSPWLALSPLGAEYSTAMSHGEGRFVAAAETIEELFRNDQVATQYVDETGRPTLALPHNPNGSMEAIEGITSPCGRIYGRMGHSERAGRYVGINICGEKEQPLFRGGVAYYTG